MCALLFPVGDTYVGSAVESVPEELICLRVAAMVISYVNDFGTKGSSCAYVVLACYIQHTPVVIGTRTKHIGHCLLFIVIVVGVAKRLLL